jgi:hypothetical protein
MASDAELQASQLAQIEADLAELAAHVDRWINDRFLSSDSAAHLSIEDVAGLVAWLRQWHTHFDSYGDTAAALRDAGLPAVTDRLALVRTEIDTSIATFTKMAAALPKDQPG